MNKHIFIVNGKATAGKSTFENMVLEKINGEIYSIIDPTKDFLIKNFLWDGITKSPETRKLMSDIKIALDNYCDYSFSEVALKVCDFKINESQQILFIDMREEADIKRAVKEFGATTIYIDNDNVHIKPSNVGDAFADSKDNYKYDILIDNSGSLADLEDKVTGFVDVLLNVGGCDEK